ncbi:MAG: aminoacyl-tRNA hydrolase [Candidatus Nomurabacteria bacterium]|jgi:PTH1 family peptidyl-tRNA hydrolase|nr:aminoacyl-tRNA hydrolase [Candidatus Nomurabacteria bacterium]
MKLIAALGNGAAYKHTRHNLGDEVLQFLLAKPDFVSQIEQILGDKVKFLLPEGFYNLSGEWISREARFYKINISRDLLVICDDFYLTFGDLRLRMNGSAGGNNGLKSIIAHLGTNNFARLRLGTDDGTKAQTDADAFVLSRFSYDEQQKLPEIALKTATKLREWAGLVKNY